MARKFNVTQTLRSYTQFKCCLLDEYKYLAKQIEDNRDRMKKIKPLLEKSDIERI